VSEVNTDDDDDDDDMTGSATRSDVAPTSGDHRASVLFQTRFKNNTKADQSYTMKTEKKTKTSMTTSVERGLTRGVEMGVQLKTPCEVGSYYSPHYTHPVTSVRCCK